MPGGARVTTGSIFEILHVDDLEDRVERKKAQLGVKIDDAMKCVVGVACEERTKRLRVEVLKILTKMSVEDEKNTQNALTAGRWRCRVWTPGGERITQRTNGAGDLLPCVGSSGGRSGIKRI
jgi:hypothetical protein